ncbi:MAG: peptidoglycan DD-metalloendopeptidase family protein, partial [Candidatus Nanopelagicaceae bacterium]
NGTHEGFDIGPPIGTKISYAVGGIVKSIDKVGKGNAGKLLEVQLENGIVGLSMHLSDVLVEVGQKFQAGQVLALTGDTGAGPAHLHQESAARAYKQGQAGASLSYLQLNGRSATGAAGVLPSPAEVAATNAQEMMAKQKVIAASLSKEAAAVFNALMNLNEVDITSKVNQDIFDLTQTLKDLRRESEDAWDDFVPENAITEGRKRIKALNRQIEDIPNKYRDISIKIEQSFRGRELAKVFGDKKFLDSTAVKNLKTELAGLGISTETIDKAFTDAAKSGGTLETALENLKTEISTLAQTDLDRLKLSLKIAVEFEPKKAALATRASIESAWGLQDPATANAQERLRLDEDIARAQAALNEAEKGTDQDAIKRSQEVVNSLKAQRLAYADLIPGVITYGELLQTAFQPAVNAFTDFVTGAKSAGEAFRSFAYEVVSGLAKIMAQAATMMIFKQIIGGLGALTGANLGGIFGFANGGVAEGGFQAFANGGIAPGGIKFRAFAGGGTVKGPTMGLVGEGRYNEAIVPLPDGKSIPVIMKGTGGEAGDNFNVNVSVDASGSKVEGDSGKAKELGQVLSTAIQAELIKQKRPGGLLA